MFCSSKNLRNFVLHRTHPFLGHTVRIADQSERVTGEIALSSHDRSPGTGGRPRRAHSSRIDRTRPLDQASRSAERSTSSKTSPSGPSTNANRAVSDIPD